MSAAAAAANSIEARAKARADMLVRLGRINDFEEFAKAVVSETGIVVDKGLVPDYYVISRAEGNTMLSTSRVVPETATVPSYLSLRVQIQDIDNGFARIGAIGDGNCMVHSLFTAASETYRKLDVLERQTVADTFRDVLSIRIDDLKEIANVVYAELGGADAFEETFDQLEGNEGNAASSSSSSGSNSNSSSSSNSTIANRSEIDVSMGPLIARMYGFNFLAVRLDRRLKMTPVKQSLMGRDPDLPTIFIHYMGGGKLDFSLGKKGRTGREESLVGHYEVIVRPVLADGYSPSEGSILPATSPGDETLIELNDAATTFIMSEADLAGVLAAFSNMNAALMSEKTKRAFLASIARKQAEGVPISPASAATFAALERVAARAAAAGPAGGAGAGSKKKATTAKKGATAGKRGASRKKSSSPDPTLLLANNSVSPSTLAAIEAMSGFHVAGSNNGGVSPSTLAAIAAMEAASASKKGATAAKKATSAPKKAASTRKKSSPAAAMGGAGAAPRRSARIRATTQKKKKTTSSNSNSISPGTRAALYAVKKANSGSNISSETRAAIAALERMNVKSNNSA